MSVNTPPTEDIPIFDPSVFPSANGSALTVATGSKYFLTYPVAQGSEIFPSNITLQSTLSDSSGGVLTGTSVIAPSFNAAADATTTGICTTQTSGTLNIGTGVRTTGGVINFGTGSGATANPINIGGSGSLIALGGSVSLSKGLTLPTTTYTATTGQIGYNATINGSNNASITLPVTLITTSTVVLRVVNLPIGYYIGTVSLAISNATVANDTITVSGSVSGCLSEIQLLRFMGPLIGGTAIRAAGVFTGGFQVTSATSTYTVSISVNTGSVSAFDTFFSYVRIAWYNYKD